MSRQYQTGNRWEQRTAELFADEGYETWQTRGSKGPADIIAIKPGQVALIQVKRVNLTDPNMSRIISGDEWNALYDLATWIGAVPVLADWTGVTKTTLRLRRLTGPHEPKREHWPAVPFHLDLVTAAQVVARLAESPIIPHRHATVVEIHECHCPEPDTGTVIEFCPSYRDEDGHIHEAGHIAVHMPCPPPFDIGDITELPPWMFGPVRQAE